MKGGSEKSIIAVTPNPALDLGGSVKRLIPDEKNYVHEETRFPGGNALNAARIIHRLGFPVEVSGFLGGGVGGEIRALVEAEGLRHEFIPIAGPSRISVTVSNLSSHHQTRLSFSGPTISKSEYESLLAYLRSISNGTLVILGGSLPPGVTAKHLQEMIAVLSEKNCECIVDVPGSILKEMQFSSAAPILIKPNLTEFQDLVGRDVTSLEAVVETARTLSDHIPFVCVSSVEGGAVLVSSHGAWFGRIPPVEVKTSVGAWDSMVGAMSTILSQWKFETRRDPNFQRLSKENGSELLRWGLAAACATLTVHGTELGSAEDIKRYLPKIEVQRIF